MRNLLGRRGVAAAALSERPSGAIDLAVEEKVKLDLEPVGVLIDHLGRALRPAAMHAEKSIRDSVENGRLAAAVQAGEHPKGRAREVNLLLFTVTKKAPEGDSAGDHSVLRVTRARAKGPRRAPPRPLGPLLDAR